MTITRINKLEDYRIYRNFRWRDTPDFGKYNLIYGLNGAGKTSLSTLFRFIQTRTVPDVGDVEFVIDGKVVNGKDFRSLRALPPIRVFNRDFIDRNIFELPDHAFPPVFYLGEDSTEKQKLISALQDKRNALVKSITKLQIQKTTATTDLNSFCTSAARSIRNLLMGDARYNNYEAPKFKELMRELASGSARPVKLDPAERGRLEQILATRIMPKLALPTANSTDLLQLTSAVQVELNVAVLSNSIQALVDSPELAKWTEEGTHLHAEGETHCHFCEQPLPPHRMAALEAHFNDHFKRHQERLRELTATIASFAKEARPNMLPERSALYPQLHAEFDSAMTELNRHSTLVQSYLDGLQRAIQAKLAEPFSTLDVQGYLPRFDFNSNSGPVKLVEMFLNGVSALGATSGFSAVQKLLNLVHTHNRHTDSFDEAHKDARLRLERDEGAKSFSEWERRSTLPDDLAQQINRAQEELAPLAVKITELERDIKQHLKPAEELNREMAAYLGRDELHFKVKDTGYTIMRGEQPALHLSDGERTAIAFMYFLKTLKDADFDLKKGVVVIDDPVSSLDANSMYCAFGYMKDRTKDAKQLFILTHNFAFFRQVKNWFNFASGIKDRPYDPSKHKNASFYMLSPTMEDGRRSATLRTLDPLLHRYESEYHYLFSCIKSGAEAAAPGSLAEVYGLPNIARRLLESFLSFRAPGLAGSLSKQLEELDGDPASKARVLRFLHTHSHMEQVEPDHELSVLSEAPSILRELLSLIQANDRPHYDAMMKIA